MDNSMLLCNCMVHSQARQGPGSGFPASGSALKFDGNRMLVGKGWRPGWVQDEARLRGGVGWQVGRSVLCRVCC